MTKEMIELLTKMVENSETYCTFNGDKSLKYNTLIRDLDDVAFRCIILDVIDILKGGTE